MLTTAPRTFSMALTTAVRRAPVRLRRGGSWWERVSGVAAAEGRRPTSWACALARAPQQSGTDPRARIRRRRRLIVVLGPGLSGSAWRGWVGSGGGRAEAPARRYP